jgi:hypothetical protein
MIPKVGEALPPWRPDPTGLHGHVVLRVEPDASYRVVVLDDADEACPVKSVHGPY